MLTLLLAATLSADPILIPKPDAFLTLVNPNCSHCVDESKRRKDELKPDDPVLCWTRGYSDGGAIPIRFFLNTYRVISDSYGVFVYDPDAGYARGFAPSYNFVFHGWRNGIMVMKDKTDGTLYSCLSGEAFAGPRKGHRLTSIPTLVSTWGEVMDRNPNAVAYRMFEKYKPVEIATKANEDSIQSRLPTVDSRLEAEELVVGVKVENRTLAIPLKGLNALSEKRIGSEEIIVLRHIGSDHAVAVYRPVARQPRKYKGPQPDEAGVSPSNPGVPLPDGTDLPSRSVVLRDSKIGSLSTQNGTQTVWRLDGRGKGGALDGWTLDPVDTVVCTWRAWSAEYPTTEIVQNPPIAPAPRGVDTPRSANDAVKQVAGTAEFLRLLPKPFATVKAVDPIARTITLLLDGEKVPKVWPVEPDAEIKVAGWWGRLEQLKPNQKVWVWLRLDRNKNAKSVAMVADESSEQEIHNVKPVEPSNLTTQKDWLRHVWQTHGLPGTATFVHVFSGEMEVTLDHEAMRWGRYLKNGDICHIAVDPPIKAVVKQVSPWRERTVVRLVVGELAASDLPNGTRVGLKVTAPPKEVDDSPDPTDLGRPRTKAERIEWFLASMYCVCGVANDICTGDFYTLASCNPNGCGAPNGTRKDLGKMIDEGKTDKQIWDELVKTSGPEMTRPHLRK